MPIWRPAPIIGGRIGYTGRYLLASALLIALGLAIGSRPRGGAVGVLAAVGLVLAFALALSRLWTAVGLVVRSRRAIMTLGHLLPLRLARRPSSSQTRYRRGCTRSSI